MKRDRGIIDYKEQAKTSEATLEERDQNIFGQRRGGYYITGDPIGISLIDLDPIQPRRVMPYQIRQLAGTLRQQITEWKYPVDQYLGVSFQVSKYIKSTDEITMNESMPALVRQYFELVNLASNIYHNQLLHPISVAIAGNRYLLESGERRLLAHHLLDSYFKGQWNEIPAVVQEEFNVWRQASENGVRQSLNAIGRARQYALLLMELTKDEYDYQEYGNYGYMRDREYYAQIKNTRVPYGANKKIMSAMGVKARSRFSVYSHTLQIDNATWLQADEEDWPESQLFRAQNNSNKHTESEKNKRTVAQDFSNFRQQNKSRMKLYATVVDRVNSDGTSKQKDQLFEIINKDIKELETLRSQLLELRS
jgi:hypothetical protein